jgi:hypothetical protein
MRKSVGNSNINEKKGKGAIICEEDDINEEYDDDREGGGMEEKEEEQTPPSKPAPAQKKGKTSVATAKTKRVQPNAAKKNAAQSLPSASAPSSLAKKVCTALEEDILSLSEDAANGLLPECTIFSSSEKGSLMHIMQTMRRECPQLCKDPRELVFQVLSLLPEQGNATQAAGSGRIRET